MSNSDNEGSKTKSKNALPPDRIDLFPIFRTLYDLILDFERAHEQFPRIHKFTVGKRLSVSLLQSLEYVIEAIVTNDGRLGHLSKAIVQLEKARILIRLSFELKAMDSKRYEQLC